MILYKCQDNSVFSINPMTKEKIFFIGDPGNNKTIVSTYKGYNMGQIYPVESFIKKGINYGEYSSLDPLIMMKTIIEGIPLKLNKDFQVKVSHETYLDCYNPDYIGRILKLTQDKLYCLSYKELKRRGIQYPSVFKDLHELLLWYLKGIQITIGKCYIIFYKVKERLPNPYDYSVNPYDYYNKRIKNNIIESISEKVIKYY